MDKEIIDEQMSAVKKGYDYQILPPELRFSKEEAEELLDMLSWSSAPGFVIAAFDRADKGDDMHEAPQVQVELLRKCLGFGQVFSYDAYVILFCSTEELSYDEIEREVGNACSMLGWKAGISDEFSAFASASTLLSPKMECSLPQSGHL